MPGTVVPYERFLEVCQRRSHVTATSTEQRHQTVIEDVLDDLVVPVVCETLKYEQCGTRSTLVPGSMEDCIG
jgi:hypothetical protein